MIRFHRDLKAPLRGVSVAILLCGSCCLLADEISWGSRVSGLRLGVAIGQGPVESELGGRFSNVASSQQNILVAREGGVRPSRAYEFEIHAFGGPSGKDYVMLYDVDAG